MKQDIATRHEPMRQRLFVADPEGDPPRVAEGRRRELFFEVPFSVAQQDAQGGVADDRFEGWQGIEFELRFFEGFSKARTWMDEPLRKELDALCGNARIRSRLATKKTTE
jgi:hypothetical protein